MRAEKITLYYADWCTHCKDMKDDWQQLEKYLDSNTINGQKVVARKYNQDILPNNVKIEGFPTIHILAQGKTIEYNGDRTFDKMKDFIENLEKNVKIQSGGSRKTKPKSNPSDRYGNLTEEDFYKMKYYKYLAKIELLQK